MDHAVPDSAQCPNSGLPSADCSQLGSGLSPFSTPADQISSSGLCGTKLFFYVGQKDLHAAQSLNRVTRGLVETCSPRWDKRLSAPGRRASFNRGLSSAFLPVRCFSGRLPNPFPLPAHLEKGALCTTPWGRGWGCSEGPRPRLPHQGSLSRQASSRRSASRACLGSPQSGGPC